MSRRERARLRPSPRRRLEGPELKTEIAHLSVESRAWVTEVSGAYELDAADRRLLVLAAEAWDRCRAARDVLDRDGVTYLDRFGAPRARPEVAVERDSRLAFLRIVRQLGFDGSPS